MNIEKFAVIGSTYETYYGNKTFESWTVVPQIWIDNFVSKHNRSLDLSDSFFDFGDVEGDITLIENLSLKKIVPYVIKTKANQYEYLPYYDNRIVGGEYKRLINSVPIEDWEKALAQMKEAFEVLDYESLTVHIPTDKLDFFYDFLKLINAIYD